MKKLFVCLIIVVAIFSMHKDNKIPCYPEHPNVPDFGVVLGAQPFEASPRSDGWTYLYSQEGLTEQHVQDYHKLLLDKGFKPVNNTRGFIIYEKGHTSVWFGSAMGSVMVAIYN